MIIWRILRDGFHFFDRRWLLILSGALVSIGLVDAISFTIRFLMPLPNITITGIEAKSIVTDMNYNDFILYGLMIFAKIWFDAFVGFTARAELAQSELSFLVVAKDTFSRYWRLFIANIFAQIVVLLAFLLAIPGLLLGAVGILFMVPAVMLAVWFSLITPVVVFTDEDRLLLILNRSRTTVYKYFGTVCIVQLLVLIPALTINGIPGSSPYYWPIIIFVNGAMMIISAVLTIYTYIHIRLAKSQVELNALETAENNSEEDEDGKP